jgi:BirA family biotin operon repressor/biotin-[acetyl-CoA-carboxylase] ligase
VYDSCPKTLFLGKKIVYLPSCHSTNDIAAELVRNNRFSEGVVVITDEQTAGRGQRGTQWVTSTGKNFTLSIVLTPTFLAIKEQFLLSEAVALGVRKYISIYTEKSEIKWPNDLYVNNLKIGGILIENAIQGARIAHSVVGIGLNINQTHFEVPRATSLSLVSGQEFTLVHELPILLQSIEAQYLRLRNGHDNDIQIEYLGNLLGYQKNRKYRSGQITFDGVIQDIATSGQLRIQLADGTIQEFGMKEVEWIWDH